ncbi:MULTISPECIES: inorganic phosphate transporter [Chryseobacterium]|uniref:Phosphate transporter n=1 Tax=Chryseobacterium indoltheticum TaxID=254 RepID=A0A381FB64_9FLAO|nr:MULTISPECIES: inorganic phosphate transporter [Chryseobacterium]AZA73660.1 inorganic phosphate transporter [Chryseobacterium indoltheticum]MDQ8143710.1 inorganic phosphate transporter [Chryseobacterium sp. CFS15]QQQ29786.1 inorganic phosphate transporter [Chryseobacterium indoltheticum]SIR39650.1 inorganic phosphate transporter, PiT family [Chryseobacterium indoltheticum]SUX43708.1 Low-affinity inorganic phosphate transporter 1 [Chryseobacterium indoltheticum]
MDFPILLTVIIALALIFDYINGFHDAANSIATIVSTKVLTPFQAVLWAAVWNFAAFFIAVYIIGEFKIGNTIAKTVNENFITLEVIFSGLIAAIAWNLLTWWFGIPSSSSHTLIGGFLGAALMHAFLMDYNEVVATQPDLGMFATLKEAMMKVTTQDVVKFSKVIPIFLFIFLAPVIGMIISIIITLIIVHLYKKSNPHKADKSFKRLQLASSALFSLGHGLNDAQKVMGIIGAALIYYHVNMLQDPVYLNIAPADRFNYFSQHYMWVPLVSFIAIALGTMSGGWKIIKTMGTKITKVTPLEGVSAETAGAITLFITDHFGIPVSTTHTITGSIIGVGLTKRISAVRWGITVSLLWAWVLTIPISAIVAGITYLVITYFS